MLFQKKACCKQTGAGANNVRDMPTIPNPSPYGTRLQTAMELAKADRNALAAALGCSHQAISQVLLGSTRALTAENNAKAAVFLRVDPFWLATGSGEPRSEAWLARQSLTDEGVIVAGRYERLPEQNKRSFARYLAALAEPDLDHPEEEGGFFRLLSTPVHGVKKK